MRMTVPFAVIIGSSCKITFNFHELNRLVQALILKTRSTLFHILYERVLFFKLKEFQLMTAASATGAESSVIAGAS